MLRKSAFFCMLLCTAAVFLFSSCAPAQIGVEDLLDAPRLSDTQTQVLEALTDEVGQDIKLKYPRTGDYRSAFTFYDVDGDGSDEAIVLYAVPENGRTSAARIVVLDQSSGRWQATGKHLPGLGQDVDFLRFEKLRDQQGVSLVIGWIPEGVDNILSVYHYEDGGFAMEYSEDYSQVGIMDFNDDGLCELLIIAAPLSGSQPYAILAGQTESGIIDTLDQVSLDARIGSFLEPVCGMVAPDTPGAVLDGYISQDTLCSTVLAIQNGQIYIPTGDNDGLPFFRTYRADGIFSEDVNGDGVIEIPIAVLPHGQETVSEDNRLYFTDYSVLQSSVFQRRLRTLVNVEQGYRFVLPESWLGEDPENPVTIYRFPQSGEVLFFTYAGDINDQRGELLRIRSYDLQGYPDRLETKNYFFLAQRGTFVYYASLPETILSEDLLLSQEQTAALFSLIN